MNDEKDRDRTPDPRRESEPRDEATPARTPAQEKAGSHRRGPMPPAGPHDSPDLTNPDATPGSGVLPGHRRKGVDTDPGGG
ncbi:hypothetical protein [Salinarimonas rosea]|uniref:hypothetical protein n=1 Tax=Salinarimonas rosea TaxID=552063 RepID=UPI0003FEBC3C|nr:hypothetical protein [Salinarimonas rosea]